MARSQTFQRDQGRGVHTPVAGDILLFPKDDGSMWFRDEWGLDTSVAPDGIYTRTQQLLVDAGGTTRTVLGLPAPTVLPATPTSSDDADGPWQTYTTVTTAGMQPAGLISAAFNLFRAGWYPRCRFIIKTPSDLTNYRLVAGFFSANPDALPTNISGAYFRYSTDVDGTAFFRTCTAAGAAPTVVTTAFPIAASTAYALGIDFCPPDPYVRGQTPPRIKFAIASVLSEETVSVHTATLPAANTALGWGVRFIKTTGGGTKSGQFSRAGFVSP